MTRTFLDLDLDNKDLPLWLRRLSRRLRRTYGRPCPTYDPDCICCRVWVAWAALVAAHEEATL